MAFENNSEDIKRIYHDMIDSLPEELKDERFYQYFYNLLETGNNYYQFNSARMAKEVDEEWVSAIEEALPALQAVVLNPRKFIEEDRQVVNIAMARNISPESVIHLLQHSDMIDKVNEDGTVIPNRILNIYKEESWNTYENRFIATLIDELQHFINKRFNVIFDSSKDERGIFFNMESTVDNYTETIDYNLQVHITEKQTDMENEDENLGIFTRISKIHRQINDLASGAFMTTMRHYPQVRHPIVKTNAIGKNLNYKACHKLWNYIHGYDRVGYKVQLVKTEPELSRQMERDIYNSFIWDYIMIRKYIDEKSQWNPEQPLKKKSVDMKYIRQVLEEILDGLDMPESNAKKLIVNELTSLMLKRRTERKNLRKMDKNSGQKSDASKESRFGFPKRQRGKKKR